MALLCPHCGEQLVKHRLLRVHPGAGAAGVALADEDALHDAPGRRVDVGIRAHHVGGRAAELEGEPLAPQRGRLRDLPADLG